MSPAAAHSNSLQPPTAANDVHPPSHICFGTNRRRVSLPPAHTLGAGDVSTAAAGSVSPFPLARRFRTSTALSPRKSHSVTHSTSRADPGTPRVAGVVLAPSITTTVSDSSTANRRVAQNVAVVDPARYVVTGSLARRTPHRASPPSALAASTWPGCDRTAARSHTREVIRPPPSRTHRRASRVSTKDMPPFLVPAAMSSAAPRPPPAPAGSDQNDTSAATAVTLESHRQKISGRPVREASIHGRNDATPASVPATVDPFAATPPRRISFATRIPRRIPPRRRRSRKTAEGTRVPGRGSTPRED